METAIYSLGLGVFLGVGQSCRLVGGLGLELTWRVRGT